MSLHCRLSSRAESLQDTFTYTISDLSGLTSTATVTVTVDGRNDAPVAGDDDYNDANEDEVLTVAAPGVFTNDYDVDAGDVFTLTHFDAVSAFGATVSISPNGALLYDPLNAVMLQALKQGESLQDTFTYTITDLYNATGTATVTVTVEGRDDAPVAGDDAYDTDEDHLLQVSLPGVLSNDTDADAGEVLTVIAFDAVSVLGAPVTIAADGELLYDPRNVLVLQALKPGESLQDTFTYTISDLSGLTSTATVTVTVDGRNDIPIAEDDRYEVSEDGELSVSAPGVLANDSDIDGDTIQVEPRTVITRVWCCCHAAGGRQFPLRSADIAATAGPAC